MSWRLLTILSSSEFYWRVPTKGSELIICRIYTNTTNCSRHATHLIRLSCIWSLGWTKSPADKSTRSLRDLQWVLSEDSSHCPREVRQSRQIQRHYYHGNVFIVTTTEMAEKHQNNDQNHWEIPWRQQQWWRNTMTTNKNGRKCHDNYRNVGEREQSALLCVGV